MAKRICFGTAALALLGASAALAQDAPVETAPVSGPVAGEETVNPDEMAAQLNARQQIRQTYTIKRTINGEVVETDQRTVVYSPGDPTRPSEAGTSAVEEMLRAFNNEVLTRTEAFEEARMDFVIADLDRDGMMSESEFVHLSDTWRGDEGAVEPASTSPAAPETARDRQYRAFVESLNPDAARESARARARQKFSFISGAAPLVSRDEYVLVYLNDFDSMDANRDGILRGEELMMFRALNRGETIVGAEQ